MKVRWTSEQQEVIRSRGSNLLVAAAAGSGKTAVLTARILNRLMEKPNIDIDELLIVTFTEAAAAEMRERIRNGIEEALKENPNDEDLQRQSALVYSARITTIHSFCLSVVRENFHVLDLDPGFRIAEEGERKLLMHDVLREVLEEKYAEKSESFQNLVECVVTKRDDTELEEMILKLYQHASSNPDAQEWIQKSLEMYACESPQELLESDWMKEQYILAKLQLQEYAKTMDEILSICEEPGGPAAYIGNLQEECEVISRAANADDYLECHQVLKSLTFGKLKAERSKDVDPDLKKLVSDTRKHIKESITKLKEEVFGQDLEMQWKDIKQCEPILQELSDLVLRFDVCFAEKKREQNIIDFSDMEHLALQILTKKENGEWIPTNIAKNYQKQFREIMIDEYQDSNLIQEVILRSVSGNDHGEYNLFMVGDVKQSIYRFRLARPELFMEKYDTYPAEEGQGERKIDLHKNFRSRREILDNANYIFRKIMHKSIGGIEYNQDAELNFGASFETENEEYRPELLVISDDDRKLEARAVALRIKELVGHLLVTDKVTGEIRPCRYQDIVILFRSITGWSEIYKEVFEEENIPTYVGSRTGYFQAREIRMMLQYLSLLDNPKQDFPLTAVMTSPMGGFDANELAMIRLLDKKKSFFSCVLRYRTEGENELLRTKLDSFLCDYEMLRKEARWRPLHELLWRIIKVTGLDSWMATRADGAQKEANISMLIQQAVRFESSSYKGVFHFVRYMEQLEKYEVDYGEAELAGQTEVVQFMSIHKSKGLEFPVVILTGMGKKFNEMDLRTKMLLHPDAGIGLPMVDLNLRIFRSTALRNFIGKKMKMDNLGEEIRVLYVALTRAKEKLIMTGAFKKIEEEGMPTNGAMVDFDSLLHAGSYMALIRLAIRAANNVAELPFDVKVWSSEYIESRMTERTIQDYEDLVKIEMLLNQLEHEKPDYEMDFATQFHYQYPHRHLQDFKMKFTVSELKMKHEPTEDGIMVFSEPEIVPLLPKFVSKEEGLTGASRGTAYHKVMELLDFSKDYSKEDIVFALDGFEKNCYLTSDTRACIQENDIYSFIQTKSGKRMHEAAKNGLLFKEQPFVLGISAEEVYGEHAKGETLLVQGIIDVYFEEEDGIVVLDYKTDQVRAGYFLKEKYATQLDYYAKALEQILHKPIKEKIIYSFTLGEEIIW